MPRPSAELKRITISDFTPGIADDPGFNWPVGQAQRTGTYQCRAKPSGALIPGPRRDKYIIAQKWELDPGPTATPGYFVTGLYASGPLIPSGGLSVADPEGRYHELWFGFDWGMTAGSTLKHQLRRLRQFEASPTWDLIHAETISPGADFQFGHGVMFGSSRANRASPNLVGVPVIAAAWGNNSAADSYVLTFPDDAAPATNTPFVVVGDRYGYITTHQNRIVIGYVTGYSHGVNGLLSTTEDLQWTNPNNPGVLSSPLQAFYPEQTDGYNIMASMGANELFMVKESGGLIASGDLDGALIRNLPGLPGAHTAHMGTRSPVGYVYGSPVTGMWAWQHGDGAVHLSPNMTPNFWRLPVEYTAGSQYQFDCIGTLIFVGNNFMFDTDTKAWWRVHDPAEQLFRRWTHFRNFLYGSSDFITQTGNLICAYGFDVTRGEIQYFWQSFPFRETLDREIDCREITCRASGAGTIYVTLTDETGATKTVPPNGFVVNSSTPQLQRADINLQGRNIRLSLEADALDLSTGTAPTIHELSIGYHDTHRIPSSQ